MSKSKIAITLAEETVKYLDDLVKKEVFANRSQAIQSAVDEKIQRMTGHRLAEECARLHPGEEQELAEESIGSETAEWPEY
ncbi:MAG: CopG family transcriptional regulator [Acidobacteria bacterium]|uniref:CopG family transcriptional regulator n=1 Tax=Candidatus Polarisedimenticola svalbardensis TaxID=2886004 RepID=A0A8J6Y6N9_9BACT|nr:CopG family transcriptional regulator [Candidatus Polarisedimenticola svalbardensis]